MATYRGIRAACEAVLKVLETRHNSSDFDKTLEFKPYYHANFNIQDDNNDRIKNGVSLYLYRILVNTAHRLPAGRVRVDGGRDDTRLPLDLHIILTVWAESPETQMEIAGWMMRVLEDHPIIPSSFLNATIDGVFQADEAVDLIIGDISQEDLFHIWEMLKGNYYQLSVPYVIRNLRLDSSQLAPSETGIQERQFDYTMIDPARNDDVLSNL